MKAKAEEAAKAAAEAAAAQKAAAEASAAEAAAAVAEEPVADESHEVPSDEGAEVEIEVAEGDPSDADDKVEGIIDEEK